MLCPAGIRGRDLRLPMRRWRRPSGRKFQIERWCAVEGVRVGKAALDGLPAAAAFASEWPSCLHRGRDEAKGLPLPRPCVAGEAPSSMSILPALSLFGSNSSDSLRSTLSRSGFTTGSTWRTSRSRRPPPQWLTLNPCPMEDVGHRLWRPTFSQEGNERSKEKQIGGERLWMTFLRSRQLTLSIESAEPSEKRS